MADYKDREQFIPIRRSELVDLLCADAGPVGDRPLSVDDQAGFRRLAEVVAALTHFRCLRELDELKDDYAPFDPDADTKPLHTPSAGEKADRLDRLFERFTRLLARANYHRMTIDEIAAASGGSSEFGINMAVEWGVFDRVEVFRRGESIGRRTRRKLKRFWVRTEEVSLPLYRRLVVLLKLRPHRALPKDMNTDVVFAKVFKDMPKMDVEMVLPGTRLKMPWLEKGKLGASVASTVGYLGWKLWGAVSIPALLSGNVWALYTPAVLLGTYGYKQWAGFRVTKQTYEYQLVQSLYFQNLDNNEGVLFRLADEAEEQECREVLLGYFYLWRYAGTDGWEAAALDDYAEIDLERRAGVEADFEIADALAKLEAMQLVERAGDRYRAVPLPQALEALDRAWDGVFEYNQQPARV